MKNESNYEKTRKNLEDNITRYLREKDSATQNSLFDMTNDYPFEMSNFKMMLSLK